MKDTVTFETAVRLKEAGFPQPTPEAGQWWYNPDIGIFLTGKLSPYDGRERHIYYPDTGNVFFKNQVLFPDCVFAPTATDILREMPANEGVSISFGDDGMFWVERRIYYQEPQTVISVQINPAEAAASAWLKLQEEE